MLRSHLPVVEYGTCAGVRVPAPAEPRRLFDRFRPGLTTPEHRPFEGGLVTAHRMHTEPGDDVVIVGGGYGITTVAATRHGRSVTVYEASGERHAAIRQTLGLNDVADGRVAVERAIVGELAPAEAREKGLATSAAPTVSPASLPACDVLELDCEGAELSILRELDRSSLPRVLAVEVHPIKLDGDAPAVAPTLRDLGYRVDRYATHDGTTVSQTAFEDLLVGETPGVGEAGHQEYPPVVVAVRSD